MMEHTMNTDGNHTAVTLTGKVYAHDAGIIRDELLKQIEKGIVEITMDLAGVSYIDSTGLGVLVTVHKRTQEQSGQLILTGITGMVAELLKRTRLDRVLTIQA